MELEGHDETHVPAKLRSLVMFPLILTELQEVQDKGPVHALQFEAHCWHYLVAVSP